MTFERLNCFACIYRDSDHLSREISLMFADITGRNETTVLEDRGTAGVGLCDS